MAAIHWDKRGSPAVNAARLLPEAAREYFAEGRELTAADAPPPGALHAFRLHTKRFRYTLEMFREVYGEPLDDYLGELRKVQTFLGDINDCATTRELLLEAMPAPSAQRRRIERAVDGRMLELIAQFIEHWRQEFNPPAQESRWLEFLTKMPRNHAKKRAITRKSPTKRAMSA
jgi:CHAD domain-containing protein